MGTSDSEPAKALLPYLQRADELQRHEPLVAYYCRLYAMDRGLRIPQKERTKTTNVILLSLMNQLEKDKKSVKLGPEDNLYLEGFASNVFVKADKQDRAGRADLNTAKTFYAASIFFDTLNQFGELQPDIEQKQKYAIWKAAQIRKAIKEGRQPEPGPPGVEEDSNRKGSYGTGPSQSFSRRQQTDKLPSKPAENDYCRTDGFSARTCGDEQSSHDADQFHPQPPVAPGYTAPSEQFHACASMSRTYTAPRPTGSGSSYHDACMVQPNEGPEGSAHLSSYPQPPYRVETPHPQNQYAEEDAINPGSFRNFQAYLSFQESTQPAIPSRNTSFYHASNSTTGNATEAEYQVAPVALPADQYSYDSNYQPPTENIAEAHKSARFAVGALAFDDVVTAVEHLKRALELLTNPSADAELLTDPSADAERH